MQLFSDEYFMKQALNQAEEAFLLGEIPVGAVVVSNNTIIAKSHNLTEQLNDVTAHAEIQAITSASEYLGGKYLNDCVLYVTLEPCLMCAGALYWSRIGRIVIGAVDEKRGANSYGINPYHPKTTIEKGLLEASCSEILKTFFEKKRK